MCFTMNKDDESSNNSSTGIVKMKSKKCNELSDEIKESIEHRMGILNAYPVCSPMNDGNTYNTLQIVENEKNPKNVLDAYCSLITVDSIKYCKLCYKSLVYGRRKKESKVTHTFCSKKIHDGT